MDPSHCGIGLAIASLALSFAANTWADVPEQNRILARTFFEQGRQLMADKKFDDACTKLAESERLDPAPGTRLNLATCHEAQGKTATAWAEFNDALTQARRDNRPERVEFAQRHIDKLAPLLSRLSVAVAPGADVEGLEVKLDGVVLGRATWGVATPVDPGAHAVAATAPRRRAWSGGLDVGVSADEKTIVVPPLVVDPDVQQSRATTDVPATGAFPAATSTPDLSPATTGTGRRTAGFVIGGIGVGVLAGGIVFGAIALTDWGDRNAQCDARGCSEQGVSKGGDANKAAWIADVGIGVGVLAVGAGAYLLVTSRKDPARAAASGGIYLTPAASARGGGLALGGGF